jgi:hypothetical protein
MEQSLAQEFKKTLVAAHEAFPEKLANLVVLLVPASNKPVYVSPQIADQLTNSTAAIRKAVKEIANDMRARNHVGKAYSKYKLNETPVRLIALNSDSITGAFADPYTPYTKEMDAIFTLDHELGHLILWNGSRSIFGTSPQLAESAADAFAMLRHIQRFGKNTDQAGRLCERLANLVVMRCDTEHYTSNAVQRAIEIADEMGDDLFKLSLRETARLAAEIADDNHLDQRTLDKIGMAYVPIAMDPAYINDWDKLCRKTIEIMREHRHDAEIFKAGKRCLNSPMLKRFMAREAMPKRDVYWKKALAFVNTHDPHARPKRRSANPGMRP